jgi:hypothetical protein
MVWGLNPGRDKRFSSFSKYPDWLRAHPPSYSMGTGALSWWENRWGVKMNIHLPDDLMV